MEVHHNPRVTSAPLGRKFILLDRDGVINRERPDYVKSVKELSFFPSALLGLRLLRQAQFRVVVVTNQSVVGRGIIDRNRLREIHQALFEAIEGTGGRIERVYYCPHTPADNCTCRKPRPGLLLKAREDLDISLERTFFVGDKMSDVLAAVAAGCRPVLAGQRETRGQVADAADSDLFEIVLRIVRTERLMNAQSSR